MIPINKMAAIVTSRAGIDDRFEIKNKHLKINISYWKNPRLMIKPVNYDVTGVCFGRLGVVGYLGKGKWQCRCVCGNYTSRKLKAIKNPSNNKDACEECRELAYLRRTRDYLETGKDKDVKDYF